MSKVEILRDTIVRVAKGSILEVSDAEAKRLAAFGNGKAIIEVAAEEEAPKPEAAAAKPKRSRKKKA